MSCNSYVKHAIKEVQRTLDEQGDKPLPNKVGTPLVTGYHPELDATPELEYSRANYYQGSILVLRWMIELGHIYRMACVAMLSRFLANPCEGHLKQAIHVFAYLKAHD
jgi:hypothetical protein